MQTSLCLVLSAMCRAPCWSCVIGCWVASVATLWMHLAHPHLFGFNLYEVWLKQWDFFLFFKFFSFFKFPR